jgi:hypothetical protein
VVLHSAHTKIGSFILELAELFIEAIVSPLLLRMVSVLETQIFSDAANSDALDTVSQYGSQQ